MDRCFSRRIAMAAKIATSASVAKKKPAAAKRRAASGGASTLLPRTKVAIGDQWDLGSLFASDTEWHELYAAWSTRIDGYAKFAGKLKDSAQTIAELMAFDAELDRLAERLGNYAFLKTTEDLGNSTYQRMMGLFTSAASRAGQAASYIRPELMAIPARTMERYLKAPALAPWKLALERMLRYRPHTLSAAEEKLLAMQAEMAPAASQIFRQLNDTDLKFGSLKDEHGKTRELGHASFSAFLQSPKRAIRKAAFDQFYAQFEGHKNALAAALNGNAQKDVYFARARNFPTAREASLFEDNVPTGVYDSLIAAVHRHLPKVHRYLELRRKALKLNDLHMYDTYVPIVKNVRGDYPWERGVQLVVDSLAPLGSEYVNTLAEGLTTGRWCDRYANAGKRSGAFSSGAYDGKPYILMNYEPTVLDHVFTLAHEAGHSMHTWYSVREQSFRYYNYPIFVAEVASTFNEQLLARHMMQHANSDAERANLINRVIDGIRGTIIRQTMFAEFELLTHTAVEGGEPLTVDKVRTDYRRLLVQYFGKNFVIDPALELECLRIPHFYSAFYVYKYATGLSAAIALSQRVINGGSAELDAYLTFLKGGCSAFPLDLLRKSGVDMESPQPVETALTYFGTLVDELEALIG
jgi:oligoendopeptidase F